MPVNDSPISSHIANRLFQSGDFDGATPIVIKATVDFVLAELSALNLASGVPPILDVQNLDQCGSCRAWALKADLSLHPGASPFGAKECPDCLRKTKATDDDIPF